jgi:hypothetical protein
MNSHRKSPFHPCPRKIFCGCCRTGSIHPNKLGIARKVKDVAGVHKTLWPNESAREEILQVDFLVHPERYMKPVEPAKRVTILRLGQSG